MYSSNGTFVNGKLIGKSKKVVISDQDQIALGRELSSADIEGGTIFFIWIILCLIFVSRSMSPLFYFQRAERRRA